MADGLGGIVAVDGLATGILGCVEHVIILTIRACPALFLPEMARAWLGIRLVVIVDPNIDQRLLMIVIVVLHQAFRLPAVMLRLFLLLFIRFIRLQSLY